MSQLTWSRGFALVVGSLMICTGSVSVSWGQKKAPPPAPPAGAPTIGHVFPLGAQRGQSLDLTLTGTNLGGAVQILTGFPAKAELIKEAKEAPDKVKVKLSVPADAPLGAYPIRLATVGGVSNLRLFCIDDLPQVVDNDGNREKAKAQSVPVPCVVAGKVEAEQSDYYKISVKAGQRLNFEVLGRRLGSPIDPYLTLYHGKSLRELAYDNDSPGCQGDPRLSYSFKEAGEYLLEIRDVLGRGGADFVYRIRIGEFPLATAAIPMAAKAGSKVQVQFAGPQVENVKPVETVMPKSTPGSAVWVSPKGSSGQAGWPVQVVVSDLDEIVEQEPNQDPTKATRVPLPGGVTGRFLPGDDVDVFVVSAKKGQKLVVEAQTLEWNSPTLLLLSVKNAKTKAELAKSNPQALPPADQRVEVTPAEDGDLFIEAQHLLYQSGPIEAYHLSIRPLTPSFEVVLSADKLEAAAGGTALLPFQVTRKGYTGPIDVTLRGQDVKADAKLKAGQTAGVLIVPLAGEIAQGGRSVEVEARATIDGQIVTQIARARPTISKSLADLVFPPIHVLSRLDLGVKEKAPFTLTASLYPPDAAPGTQPSVVITVKREDGFKEEITLNPPVGLPANVPVPKVGAIAKDKGEIKFTLDVNAKTTAGDYFVLISGKAKSKGRDVSSDPALLALPVGAPFALTIEAAKVELKPGEKVKIKVNATRKAGYKGPIALDFKNLPAKVTGTKGTIAADKTSAELDLSAAADVAAVERVEFEVVGTATALNNLQGSSPAAALRIAKK